MFTDSNRTGFILETLSGITSYDTRLEFAHIDTSKFAMNDKDAKGYVSSTISSSKGKEKQLWSDWKGWKVKTTQLQDTLIQVEIWNDKGELLPKGKYDISNYADNFKSFYNETGSAINWASKWEKWKKKNPNHANGKGKDNVCHHYPRWIAEGCDECRFNDICTSNQKSRYSTRFSNTKNEKTTNQYRKKFGMPPIKDEKRETKCIYICKNAQNKFIGEDDFGKTIIWGKEHLKDVYDEIEQFVNNGKIPQGTEVVEDLS